jgi:hypothetical protein
VTTGFSALRHRNPAPLQRPAPLTPGTCPCTPTCSCSPSGTALLNTIAASSTATYLLAHGHGKATTNDALVHGFSTAYWWAVGFLVLSALFSLIAVNAPRPDLTASSDEATSSVRPAPVH